MIIESLVKQEIDIPDAELPALAEAVRFRFGLLHDAPVHGNDLVAEAINRGLVPAPDNEWEVNDDVDYEAEELAPKPVKKRRKK